MIRQLADMQIWQPLSKGLRYICGAQLFRTDRDVDQL
jgi:hypothetical protein